MNQGMKCTVTEEDRVDMWSRDNRKAGKIIWKRTKKHVTKIRTDLLGEETGVPVGRGHYFGSKPLPYRYSNIVTRKDMEEYDPADYEETVWFQVLYKGKWQCAVEIDWDCGS